MIHELKTWPEYFQAVKNGRKTFEARINDRNFKLDDTLVLREYNPKTQKYTGRQLTCLVTYILDKQPFVPEGYVVMGIWVRHFNWREAS